MGRQRRRRWGGGGRRTRGWLAGGRHRGERKNRTAHPPPTISRPQTRVVAQYIAQQHSTRRVVKRRQDKLVRSIYAFRPGVLRARPGGSRPRGRFRGLPFGRGQARNRRAVGCRRRRGCFAKDARTFRTASTFAETYLPPSLELLRQYRLGGGE